MEKLTFDQKIVLQIALKNFIESREDAKRDSYIPIIYLNRDIETAQELFNLLDE